MKLKYSLTKIDMGDEIINVPVGDNADELHAVFKLNNEAQFIVNLLESDVTEEYIISEIMLHYDTNAQIARKYVDKFINQLKEADLLVE